MARIRIRSSDAPTVRGKDVTVMLVDENGQETPLENVVSVRWQCGTRLEKSLATIVVAGAALDVDAETAPDGEPVGPVGDGRGTTNITVNMTVSSDRAPGQIAKTVCEEIAKLRRAPRPSAPEG